MTESPESSLLFFLRDLHCNPALPSFVLLSGTASHSWVCGSTGSWWWSSFLPCSRATAFCCWWGEEKKKKAPSKHRCWAGGTQPDANICIRHTQLFALFLVLLREPLHLHWLHKVAFPSAKATSAEEFRRAPTVLLSSPHRCSYVLACCSSFWGSRASASSGKKNGRPFLCRCG